MLIIKKLLKKTFCFKKEGISWSVFKVFDWKIRIYMTEMEREIPMVEVGVEVQWRQHYKESSATRYLKIMMKCNSNWLGVKQRKLLEKDLAFFYFANSIYTLFLPQTPHISIRINHHISHFHHSQNLISWSWQAPNS